MSSAANLGLNQERKFVKNISICNEEISVLYELRHEISYNVVCATSKGSDQPGHTRSLIRAFASRLNII